MLKALDDVGLAESDITLFKTKGSDVPTLVMNGDVDAGVTWEPHSSIAIASGKARVLKRAKEIMPLKNGFYLGGGVYAREEFIDQHPEILQDIVTAEVKAIDFILKNPDEAALLWHEQIKTPVDVIRTSLREGLSAYSLDAVPEEATLRKFTDWLKGADILKPTDNVKIDPSFAIKALQEVTR
jgi:ABC-type nitrate/sulfonate/bicarbonate transport system substrate-binding protein